MARWVSAPRHAVYLQATGGDQLFDPGGRAELDKATVRAHGHRPSEPTSGKVVAELTFGLRRFLSAAKHEKTLWVPALHHAFTGRTSRAAVHQTMGRLNHLRNRVAHHEQLLHATPGQLDEVTTLAGRIDPTLGRYIAATTTVPILSTTRP